MERSISDEEPESSKKRVGLTHSSGFAGTPGCSCISMRKVQHAHTAIRVHVHTFVPLKRQSCPLTSSCDKLFDPREFDVPAERDTYRAYVYSNFLFRVLLFFFLTQRRELGGINERGERDEVCAWVILDEGVAQSSRYLATRSISKLRGSAGNKVWSRSTLPFLDTLQPFEIRNPRCEFYIR